MRHLDKDNLPSHKHWQKLRHTSFTGHTSLEFCHLNVKIGISILSGTLEKLGLQPELFPWF